MLTPRLCHCYCELTANANVTGMNFSCPWSWKTPEPGSQSTLLHLKLCWVLTGSFLFSGIFSNVCFRWILVNIKQKFRVSQEAILHLFATLFNSPLHGSIIGFLTFTCGFWLLLCHPDESPVEMPLTRRRGLAAALGPEEGKQEN